MRTRGKGVVRPALVGVMLGLLLGAMVVPAITVKSQGNFRVRVLNAVPDSTGVDVWIDDVQLMANGQYKSITTYTVRQEGNYAISVFQPGKQTTVGAYVYKQAFFFHAPKDYTIIVLGRQADNSVAASVEIDRNAQDGTANARVRFGNYIPGTGVLTLATAVTNTVLGNARFGETDEYATIPAGTYTLTLNNGNTLVMKMDNVPLGPDTSVSVWALGINGGTPAPMLLITTDVGTAPAPATTSTGTTAAPTAPLTATPIPPTPTPTSMASAALKQALNPVPSSAATSDKVFYAATGHTLGGPFKTYWEQNGGLSRFGYPVTEEFQDVSLTDGKTYTTQWFERARFEYHPENKGTQYEVLTGLLGNEMLKLMGVK
jgi:hypothetical protein